MAISRNLLQPFLLSLIDLNLESIKHADKAILVKRMSKSFSFGAPSLIWDWKKEGFAKHILKDSLNHACFVEQGIFGGQHVLDSDWIPN